LVFNKKIETCNLYPCVHPNAPGINVSARRL